MLKKRIKMRKWLSSQWYEYRAFILFVLLMVMFRSALADWNVVPSGSMRPTIVEGDRILVNKIAYDIRLPFSNISLKKIADPKRGDIVVFDSKVSDIRLVKRVVGVPGDDVQMRQNTLTINGKTLSYIVVSESDRDSIYQHLSEDLPGAAHMVRIKKLGSRASSFGPITIPDNYYLALGDNRDNSADSRVIGLVPRNEIIGRTRSVVMSLNYNNNYLPRNDRFFHTL
ncbi:MAG: signal peptidase I [Arenicella sp.]|jgi:signal peptidase I